MTLKNRKSYFELKYFILYIILLLLQPIPYSSTDQFKKSTTTKRIWIFEESSSAREGYDQHLGARINQQGHDLYEISDNYKDEKS